MKTGIARVVFALQGLFLLFTSTIFLFTPGTVSEPGAQFEGTADDVVANFGLSSMTLGIFFVLIAARAPRTMFKETLILSVPLRFVAVLVQLNFGGKWVNVAVSEGAIGIVNGICALLMD